MSTAKKGGIVVALSAAVAAIAVPFVGGWEGRRTVAYRDIVGVWTICDGETRGVTKGMTATPAQCEAMLRRALNDFYRGALACAPGLKTDRAERVVAHVSIAYNIGTGAYCKSSIVRRYNAGDVRGSCDAFLLYRMAGGKVVRGLERRREAERALCVKGL